MSNPPQLWQYLDPGSTSQPSEQKTEAPLQVPASAAAIGFTEDQVALRVRTAVAEFEQQWRMDAEDKEQRRNNQFQTLLRAFADERMRYFQEAEGQVTHLALAIARKIIAREVALDQHLLAALVRLSLDRIHAGSAVKLRVPSDEVEYWQRTSAFSGTRYICDVIADTSLLAGDCLVETDLGSANVGLEAQLKEIEQGVLDLLRLRPDPVVSAVSMTTGESVSSAERVC